MGKTLGLIISLSILMASQGRAAIHVTEQPVTLASGNQQAPVISGNRVAYEDFRTSTGYLKSDIYVFDLATSTEIPYATDSVNQEYNPTIWGGWIAYQFGASLNKGTAIYASPSLGVYLKLTVDGPAYTEPWLSSGFCFWETWPNPNYASPSHIVGYNLETATEFMIDNTGRAYAVHAGYPWVVYQMDNPTTYFDLRAKNVVTGEVREVCAAAEDQMEASTDGRTIVWEDWRSGEPDIYAYDIITGITTQLTFGAPQQMEPDVSGNFIVYEHGNLGSLNIYCRDLATGTTFPVCTAPGDQRFPRVDGNRIVWDDKRNAGIKDIYMAVITRDWVSYPDIAAVKILPNLSEVALSGRVVTAVFPTEIYIQDPNRNSGIRVRGRWQFQVGDRVNVCGVMATDRNEREIMADTVTLVSSGSPLKPYSMITKYVGGIGFDPAVPSLAGAVGVHNVGSLITVWGKVTAVGAGCFYIDDGCKLLDGSGSVGLRIAYDSTMPEVGDYVTATGISSCELIGAGYRPKLLTRSSSDVTVLD